MSKKCRNSSFISPGFISNVVMKSGLHFSLFWLLYNCIALILRMNFLLLFSALAPVDHYIHVSP
jgi:hypothetical protein